MLNIVKKILGTKNDRELKRLRPVVEAINKLEPTIAARSDAELRAKTDEFRTRIREQTTNERAALETLQTQEGQADTSPESSDTDSKDLRAQIEEADKALREAENRVL